MDEIIEILFFGLFLISLWAVGKIFSYLYATIIGEIIVGIFFASAFDLIGNVHSLMLLGKFGLMLVVFEGGLSVNMKQLRIVGARAFFMALQGTVLPTVLGYGTLTGMGFDSAASLAGGAALASTAIGISTILMQQAKILNTTLGVLITSAAMLDDVFSLILLTIVGNLGHKEKSKSAFAWNILHPIVASVGTIVIGLVIVYFMPKIVEYLKSLKIFRASKEVELPSIEMEPSAEVVEPTLDDYPFNEERFNFWLLIGMVSYGFLCVILSGLAGSSYLLGSFVAGMAFSQVPESPQLWEPHLSQLRAWLLSLFFASIGFVIPVQELFDPKSIYFGLAYTAISFVAKLLCGVYAKPLSDFWVVGLAMVGRGEVGLLMASHAYDIGIMPKRAFVITMWSILINTFVAPFLFHVAIKRKKRNSTE